MEKDELYAMICCALTHDLSVCESCKKCQGKNCAEIRLNLIKELSKILDINVPWEEENND